MRHWKCSGAEMLHTAKASVASLHSHSAQSSNKDCTTGGANDESCHVHAAETMKSRCACTR